MIQRSLGDDSATRRFLTAALRINPHLSPLHAQTAQATLAKFGGTV